MSDAISNLGGGGFSTPYLANLANSLNYVAGCIVTLVGGPLINKIGIKGSCMIAALAFPLDGSSFYVSAKYAVNWYLFLAKVITGLTSGFLYVAETAAMLSYPNQDDRGLYLGIWSAMRSSGSVIGGAINFSTNYATSSAGGIAWSTYLIFVGFECTGPLFACLLSPTGRVRRKNGARVPTSGSVTWRGEFRALWRHAQRPKTWLVLVPAFYSFFYGGTMGTYLALHFSVRARALSTLLVPLVTIVLVLLYGRLLDNKRWSTVQRAWLSFLLWAVPQAGCLVWIGVEYATFQDATVALDYARDGRAWAAAYVPYLVLFTTGYWTQLSLYWILGTFSTDAKASARTGGLFRAFETCGQAVSYALNATAGDARTAFYVHCGVLALAIPCMVGLIRLVPETPSEIDPDAGDQPDLVGKVREGTGQEEAGTVVTHA